MTGVNGVNPSDDKFSKIKEDGKITYGEVKGLSDAEKAELAAGLSGVELPKKGEITYLKDPDKGEWGKRKSHWFKDAPTWAKVGYIAAGAVVAGLTGWGVAALVGKGLGALAAVTVGGLVVGACNPLQPDIEETTFNTTYIVEGNEVTTNINHINEISIPFTDVIAAIKAMHADMNANHAEQMALLKSFALEQIKANKTLDAILNKLKELGATNDDIKAILLEVLGSVNEFKDNTNTDMKQIIDVLGTLGVDVKAIATQLTEKVPALEAKLEAILAEIKKGNTLSAENNQLLGVIIEKLGKIDANDAAAIALLEKMLTNLYTVIKNQQTGNDKLQTIINKMGIVIDMLDKLTAQQKQFFIDLMDKLDKFGSNEDILAMLQKLLDVAVEDLKNDKEMSKQQQAYYEAVLKYLDSLDVKVGKLGEQGKAALDALLEAIKNNTFEITTAINGLGKIGQDALNEILKAIKENTAATEENTKVAKGTYDITVLILANMDKLNGKADAILEAIENIAIGDVSVNVDLTDVTKLLQEILAQEKLNGETQNKIYNKLCAFIEKYPDYSEVLQKILEKIPPEHECDHSELINILLELKVVIEEIKDGVGNNEGILDDLNNLLG